MELFLAELKESEVSQIKNGMTLKRPVVIKLPGLELFKTGQHGKEWRKTSVRSTIKIIITV